MAGQRLFRSNTCHCLRKRPVSWEFPASRAVAFGVGGPAVSMRVRHDWSGWKPQGYGEPGRQFRTCARVSARSSTMPRFPGRWQDNPPGI